MHPVPMAMIVHQHIEAEDVERARAQRLAGREVPPEAVRTVRPTRFIHTPIPT